MIFVRCGEGYQPVYLAGRAISHDKIARFVARPQRTATDLWRQVRPYVRQIQSDKEDLIIDDSIVKKPATGENGSVCWHYDHAKDRLINGINLVTALYYSQGVALPVGLALIAKT